jgi:hypothetical protein
MERLLRNSKLLLLSAVLALGSLTFAATAMPAAHAAPQPTIDARGQGGGVQVYGWQFTAGATVRVELLDPGLLHTLSVQYFKAWQGTGSYGVFDTLISPSYPYAGYSGSVWVAVDQAGHPTSWAKTYIYPAPYITTQGETRGVQVSGSGFTPGATVRVEAFDPSLKLVGVQYVTANAYGIDAGTLRATLLVTYVGYVYVIADESPKTSNWTEAYVS